MLSFLPHSFAQPGSRFNEEGEGLPKLCSLCQRYYHKADVTGSLPFWLHPLTTSNTNYRRQNYNFPIRMRATPSMTVTCSGTGTETTSGVELTTSTKVGLINDMTADSGQHYATCEALVADAEM